MYARAVDYANPRRLHCVDFHNRFQQTSEDFRPKSASVMAALSVKRSTALSVCISVFLLLIFIQMVTSLVLYAGVFILSNEVLISPFHFCLIHQHGELSCGGWPWCIVSGAECEIKMNIPTTVGILSLYVPVVLVAFALLAMMLASYTKDRMARWFSMVCQAASSLLILTGIISFLVLYHSYVCWENMTIWFYICVGVQVELVIITVLTCVSGMRLTSDWE
ncbi:uncharacterized protein LOC131973874 [Centropristis striata]|uniref:uncharacterized protein LOC131973874 n=1 Tax=Centropristis striata TaxID=184440 RepID=UPI0027DFC86E|nr:uncharacterized protein LOC131973874 [Centropristis striata]